MHRLESFDKFGKIIVDFRSVGLTITPLLGFVLITYASLFSVFVCNVTVIMFMFVYM